MKKHENLVLGRTFSKVYSLAGLRIGYAFTPAGCHRGTSRAGTPFTVNSVSAAAAAALYGHCPCRTVHSTGEDAGGSGLWRR
jgi:histidinol-phosphate/aromatic aminotransferase/cobyric acid decarboxylase-like protein